MILFVKRVFVAAMLIMLGVHCVYAQTNFSVSGGYLIDPTGAKFIPEGTNVADYNNFSQIIQNSSGFPVKSLFPKLNYIRIGVCEEGGCNQSGSSGGSQPTSISYPPASNYAAIATLCQTNKIVCEFEDHTSNGGLWEFGNLGTSSGVQSRPPTGSLLTSVTTFWASMATQFKGNPYAWIGSLNEMNSADGSENSSAIAAISTYELALYNAIRATGNANIVSLQAGNSGGHAGTMGPNSGLSMAAYAGMTNVVFFLHLYSSDTVANIQATMAGTTTSPQDGGAGCSGYLCAQLQTTLQGVPPIIYNEFGSANGDPTTTDGANIATAMTNVQSSGIGSGSFIYFEPSGPACPSAGGNARTEVCNGGTAGLTVGSGGNQYHFNTWGTEIAALIAANPFPGGGGGVTITAPPTLTATQSITTNVPSVSVADTSNPGDTMTFTGVSTLNGKLSAVGAGGNGTATITFTGSLTALNTLMGTITFNDAVVENPKLTFTVSDQHSNSNNTSTAVTVTAGAIGGVTPPVAGCTKTSCTGTALPSGYLNISGNQIKSASGTNVRLACVVYGGTTGALADFQAISTAGFNCVRIDWRDVYVASSGTGSGPPVATLGLGSVTDSAGNVYTIDLTGHAIEAVGGSNPTLMANGSGTNLLEKFNGQVLFESRGCSPVTWYTWNGSTFTATTSPTTLGSIAITAGSGALADCTGNIYSIGTTQHATPGVGTVTDGSGNVWTVTAGGVAQENGVTPGTNFNVTDLYLVGNVIWVVNTTPTWYYFTQTGTNAGFFTQGTAPSLTGGGGALENGTAMAGGSAMTQAELYNGVIYFNSGTNWFTWSGTAFVSATAPPPPGSGGTVTPPTGCNSLTQITSCVANATSANLGVIFNHLGNEVPASGSACITRQQNGLWFDSGLDSGGSDGCGTSGTVTPTIFQTNTVALLQAFAGNTTVIGYEFHNEPMMAGVFTVSPSVPNGGPPVNWGGGGPTDIQAACGTVGAAVFAVNPGVIEFCPGPINNTGTLLLNGTTSTSFSGITTTNFSDLSGVAAHPVTGFSAAKIAYSIHLFPCNVQNTSPDEPVAGIVPIWNAYFGSVVINGTAPVVNMAVGCSCDNSNGQTADDAAFMTRWVSYANGLTTGGPSFTSGQQAMGNAWYNWSNSPTANPNGALNPDSTLKGSESGQNGGQNSFWSQLLQGTITAPVGNRPIILILGENKPANDNMKWAMAK